MKVLKRILGVALIIAAVGGLLFSLVALYGVWRYKEDFTQQITGSLVTTRQALETTAAGLDVASQSMQNAITSVIALQSSIEATAVTLDQSRPLIDTLISLTSEELPNTLEITQTSLESAKEGARVIDSIMRALRQIPFVSRDLYNPPIPLHEAIQEVSDSLDPLPENLVTIKDSLEQTSGNLDIIQADVQLIAADIQGIQTSLEEGQNVVKDYQALVVDLQARLEHNEQQMPVWIDLAAWVLTFIFIWTAIGQLGLLVQGFELLNDKA